MEDPVLGQRHTRQRDAILNVIRASGGPLTVHEIHERAQGEVSRLGIATVYRTLKLLLDAELVRNVILPSGETRFESAQLGHHHHFQCRRCDGVFDLDVCPMVVPTSELPAGFLVDGHEITLYGICPTCRS